MKNSHIIFCLLVLAPAQILSSGKTLSQSGTKFLTAQQQPIDETTQETDPVESPKTPAAHTPEAEPALPASTLTAIARAAQLEHSERSDGGSLKQQTDPAHSPLRFISRISTAPAPREQRKQQVTTAQENREFSQEDPLLEIASRLGQFNRLRSRRLMLQPSPRVSPREFAHGTDLPSSKPAIAELFTRTSAIAVASSTTIGGLGIVALAAKALLQVPRRTITDPTEIVGYIKAGIGVAATILVISAVCFGITRIRTVIGSMKDAIEHGFQTNSLLRSQTQERLQLLEDQLNKICADNNRTNEEIQADITRLSELVQQAVSDISKMLASINKFRDATQQEISVVQGLCLTVTNCDREIKQLQQSSSRQQARIEALETKRR